MKNKLLKSVALCSAVLLGGIVFSGCSLTFEQQSAIDLLTSRADELVGVIDKQNNALSKKEAVEMLELARTRINYMWDIDAMSLEGYNVSGLSIDQIKIKIANEDVSKINQSYTIDNESKSSIVYYEDENRISKYNYDKNEIYWYDLGTKDLELYTDRVLNIRITDADPVSPCLPSAVLEDEVFDISQNADGSYTFTLFAEKTLRVDDKGTKTDSSDDIVTHNIINMKVNVKNGYITRANGYRAEYEFSYELAEKEYEKDGRGNYVIRYYDNVENTSVEYLNCIYKYNDEADLTKLKEALGEAEQKYNELYS